MTTKVSIGTISHGTLRDEDLLEAFADELERLTGNETKLVAEARGLLEIGMNDGEASSNCVAELMDALNKFTPPHVWFGAHEGDGSDFGFWPDMDSFDGCHTEQLGEPSALSRSNEWIDIDCRVLVQINDHGNITVSELRGAEIWSAV